MNTVRDESTTILMILKRPCHEEFTHYQKVDEQADRHKAHANNCSYNQTAGMQPPQTEQLSNPDVRHYLEVEAGQRPECKDNANRSPMYKGYCAQLMSLAVGVITLECRHKV
jgi:hypothetical protein